MTVSAYAAGIDFDIFSLPQAGVICYAGGATPLTSVPTAGCTTAYPVTVHRTTGVATPLNAGVPHDIVGGRLSFTTGPFTDNPNTFTWNFAGGGFITLEGAIPTIGISDSVLFTGTFDFAMVLHAGGGLMVEVSAFSDFKNKALLDYFGMPEGPYQGAFTLHFFVPPPISAPGSFTSTTIGTGEITNVPRVSEPGIPLLLGLGLLSLVISLRMRPKFGGAAAAA
jgi:hypothetical protein